MKLLEIRRDAE